MGLVICLFRDRDRPRKWFCSPVWGNYTQFNISDKSIKLSWNSANNTGFYYKTEIQICVKNDAAIRATKLTLYPWQVSETDFYTEYIKDTYWTKCNITTIDMRAEYTFDGLTPGSAYRFKLRQIDLTLSDTSACSVPTQCTNWTEVKPIGTQINRKLHKNEWSVLNLRGTGLNNHNSSFIKID